MIRGTAHWKKTAWEKKSPTDAPIMAMVKGKNHRHLIQGRTPMELKTTGDALGLLEALRSHQIQGEAAAKQYSGIMWR